MSFGDIKSVGERAFYGCESLAEIELPDTLINIGTWAFASCKNLKSVFIGIGVSPVGEYAFDNCDILTISCEAEACPEGWSELFNPRECPISWGCSRKGA